MSLFSKTWKLLTEDPSKDISKKQELKKTIKQIKEDYPNAYSAWSKNDDIKLSRLLKEGKSIKELSDIFERTEGAIESRVEKIKQIESSLIERLKILKDSTFMSQDVSIKDIRHLNGSPRTSRYDGWSRYNTRQDDIFDVLIEVSGRTIFDRLVPDFPGLSERDIMGRPGRYDYHCGVIKIDNHRLKVKKVTIWMTVWEETEAYHYYGDKDSKSRPFYKSQIKSVLIERETIRGEVSLRDISNLSSIQSQSLSLNNVIFNYSDSIKKIAEKDLSNEIDTNKKEKYLTELVKSFGELDKDTLDDLLAYISDDLGHHKVTIGDKKQQGVFNYFVGGLDNFWNIRIDISEFKNGNSTYSMNGKLSSVIIEVSESIERMKKICERSNIEMSFVENEIILSIRPLYPTWLGINPPKDKRDLRRDLRRNRNVYDNAYGMMPNARIGDAGYYNNLYE